MPPTMVAPEEYVDVVNGQTERYCRTGNTPYMGKIVPLSYDWTMLKDEIGKLQPTGNTNQGIGMAWAWLTLGVGVQPFNAPASNPAPRGSHDVSGYRTFHGPTVGYEEQVTEHIPCGPDPEPYVEAFRTYVDAGFDHLYFHQIGPDQDGFLKFFERELLPRLRSL